jgi:hypothetical protein
MLTTYFVRPFTLARLETGPAGPYLSAFATALHHQRYAPDTICQYLRSVDALSSCPSPLPLRAPTVDSVSKYTMS